MTQNYRVKVVGTHPITGEPFTWFVYNFPANTVGIKYRLLPDQPSDWYSLEEAQGIKDWCENCHFTVELIPVNLN